MRDTTLARLSTLSREQVAELIDNLWEKRGWSTSRSGSRVLATRDTPFEESLDFRVDAGIETTRYGLITGKQVRSYSDVRTDADILIVVATEPFSRQAIKDAERYGIKLIGEEALATLVETHDSVGFLTELAEGRTLYELAEEELDITFGETEVTLNGDISGTENLVSFVQFLVRNGYLTGENVPLLVGRTRYLINTEPTHKNGSDMRRPRQVGNFWVETDFSLDAKRSHIQTLAEETGFDDTRGSIVEASSTSF